MTIRSLIFDLDGTLIDSSDGVVDAVNFAFRQMGLPEHSADVIKPYIGYPLMEMYADLTDAPAGQFYHHFQTRAITSVVDSSVILPEVSDALTELRARGFHMAIATTKIRVHVDAIVQKFGWSDIFDASVAGNEVREVKPNAEAIHLAMQRLNAIASSTLVIGDTENDILAAQGVPTRVVAVKSPYGGDEKLTRLKPDFFIQRLPELLPILERTNGGRTAVH
ncbi:MAG: HAD-IA family hydrolase [bacterium]|nr:HAD-IA family hydrolase [bacterium]